MLTKWRDNGRGELLQTRAGRVCANTGSHYDASLLCDTRESSKKKTYKQLDELLRVIYI